MEQRVPDGQLTLLSMATVAVPEARAFSVPQGALRLLFVHHGTCTLAVGEAVEALAGDRMVLLRTADAYRIEAPSDDLLLCQLDFSHISCARGAYSLAQLYAEYPDYRRLCRADAAHVPFHDRFALVRYTAQSLSKYAAYDPPYRQQYTSMTLAYLLLVIASAAQERTAQTHAGNRHVRRAVEYMHEHYMLGITAEDIAAHVGVHAGHVHRLFREEMDTRVTTYLTGLRIDKAKALLQRTDTPIAEVSALVGVSSPQYFCRLFKRHTGMTPQAWRLSYNVTCDYGAGDAGTAYDTIDYAGGHGCAGAMR